VEEEEIEASIGAFAMIIGTVQQYFLAFILSYLLFWVVWFWIHIDCLAFMMFSKDKKWKTVPPPSSSQSKSNDAAEVELIFVRHGESTWNTTFNRSKMPWKFVPRLLDAAFQEIMLIITGQQDSWFIDSPLSDLGLAQAEEFKTFLSKNKESATVGEEVKLLLGESETKSTMLASNLRRAISTGVVGAWDRIQSKEEKIMLHSALQEISTNPDTMSITPGNTVPVPSWIEKDYKKGVDITKGYKAYLDPEFHAGNKTLDNNGQQRMLEFNKWAFANPDLGTLVCYGHSLWFRSFFKEFLPAESVHISKTKKMENCAAVKLTMKRILIGRQPAYIIDEKSIKIVYKGFEGSKKK